jgi:PAS domain S-box-containing protein
VYTLPLLLNSAAALILALSLRRLPQNEAVKALAWIILAASAWSFGYALEISSPTLSQKLFWEKMEYLGMVLIPPLWLQFSIYSAGLTLSRWPRWAAWGLWIIPIVTLFLSWTYPAQNLLWVSAALTSGGPFPMLVFTKGPWFWVNAIWSYGLVLSGSLLLAAVLIRSSRIRRAHFFLGLAAVLTPLLTSILYLTQSSTAPQLDLTPFAFSLSGLFFFTGLHRTTARSKATVNYGAIMKGMADGVIVIDLIGRILDINGAASKIVGIPQERLVGERIDQILSPSMEGMDFRSGQELNTQVVLGAGDDRHLYSLRMSPMIGEGGRQTGSLLLIQLNPPHFQPAAAQIQEIIDTEPDAMLLLENDAKIKLANRQAENLFGFRREELLHQDLEILLPERYRAAHRKHFNSYFMHPFARPMGANLSLFALKQDGTEFPVDISLSPLGTGEMLMVACFIRDISERKEVERALIDHERTYRALFEYANDSIFILDLKGRHLQVNQKAADLLGYTRKELVGMTAEQIVAPAEYPVAVGKA